MSKNSKTSWHFVSFLLWTAVSTESSRILFVFQFPSFSHQIAYQPLWRELSLRGHQVTVVTPYPLKDASLVNLTEIHISNIGEPLKTSMAKDASSTEIMKDFYATSAKLMEVVLAHPDVIELYTDPSKTFDLIVTECMHPGMYSLAAKFRAAIIGVSSQGVDVATHSSLGNPIHPVLFPDLILADQDELNWRQKLHSIYFSLWLLYYYNYVVVPEADSIARKYLGEDLPYLGDIGRDVSLIFTSTNPVIYRVRPDVPTVVTLGQMHLRPPKPLSKVLQDILDNSQNGVVYFSLGSNMNSSELKKTLQKVIVEAIASLPYTVLWKVDTGKENLPDMPENIIVQEWFPQQDLLAHPNIRVFVTQGDLQSIEEAIIRGVPMVGLPFLGEQAMNVKKMSKAGIGLEVDPSTATIGELRAAIMEVAQNRKYRLRIQESSKILDDQPMTSLEKAVWWTEYVIRHNGTKILRSPTADSPWWEYFLLDILGIFVIVLFICYKMMRYLLKLVNVGKNKVKVN
ncbi:unnamed protein product [Phaedon cochleariae]|uniref:UDP-glucuronosyltransferase n=1 Tax=Phaedon cochleariae TaxID=80249 RepID=A0A9N9SFS0_PHACE|nr:unnamed protein product [Phaedon cochleariae]